LPPISFGFGLLAIFGKYGILYLISGIRLPLLGEFGVVLGLVLYTFPTAFLMFQNALSEMDGIIYESAMLLGIPMVKYLFYIIIPQLKKTIISAVLLVCAMSLSEYSICLVVGGKLKTISLLIYREVTGSLNFSAGILLGCMLLVPVFFMLLWDSICPQTKNKMIYKKLAVFNNKRMNVAAYVVVSFVSAIFLAMIFSFVMACFSENYPVQISFSLANLIRVVSQPYLNYYINSVVIAAFVSIIGCFLSLGAAYFANKNTNTIVCRMFYIISIIPNMIPGIIFGIGYMIAYKGSILSNTYTIIILADIAHFFTSPFLLAYRSFCDMSPEYTDIAQLYGIYTRHMFFEVYLPYMRNTCLDMFFYYFANAMITISAVVFLYTNRTMPYAVILNNFEGSIAYLSKSASVSLVILLTNAAVYILISKLKLKI